MKLALCEFDVGQDWTRYTTGTWVNYGAGIFYTDFTGDYPDIADTWHEGAETFAILRVGSVFAFRGNTTFNLTSVSSISALNPEPSFYFNETDKLLYVRLPEFDPPDLFGIVVGAAARVAQSHYIDEDGAQQYDGDLKSLPSISKSIDPLFFGKLSFNDATVVLNNLHGEYDSFASFDVFGQPLRLYFGNSEDAYSDFTQVWTGYIDDFIIGENEIRINASDPRRKLETPIPPNVFDTTTYTDLKNNDENKPIPLAYGTLYNVVPKCVNRGAYDKATGGDLTFKLCDVANHTNGISSIDDVYYNGVSLTGTSGTDDYHWDTAQDSLTDATFVINLNADVDFDFDKVTVDFKGVLDTDSNLISDGLDVIKDLIEIYSGTAYVNANFDTEQWEDYVDYDKPVGLYIDKESTVIEAIEQVTASTQMQFDVTGEGRYTVRVFDDSKPFVRIIDGDELFGDIELNYNSDEFLSRVVVDYANGLTYVYDDEEAAVNKRFKYKRPKTFETILTTATAADTFAQKIMELSGELKPLITAETKTQNIDLNIEDIVIADFNRRNAAWLGFSLCRVEKIDIDLNNFTVSIGLRVLTDSAVDRGSSITLGDRVTTDLDTRVTAQGDVRIFYEVVED